MMSTEQKLDITTSKEDKKSDKERKNKKKRNERMNELDQKH